MTWLSHLLDPDAEVATTFVAGREPAANVALTPDEQRTLSQAALCTGCELCNAVCPLVANADAAAFGGPMEIALRLVRSAPDFHTGAAGLRVLDRCGPCRACEQCCPQQIPLLALYQVLRSARQRHARDDDRATPARDRKPAPSGPG
jgi:succinate dehydrogenase/fumarate reductase-like Fe-S protein